MDDLRFPLDGGYITEAYVQGKVYMWRDGWLRMYLGRNNRDETVFYTLARCGLENSDFNEVRIVHQKEQSEFLNGLIKQLLHSAWDVDFICSYTSKPKIRMVWADYTEEFSTFIDREKEKLEPFAITYESSDKNAGFSFVKAKDLIAGAVYFSGSSPWRSTYIYLGRDKTKRYVYVFVGTPKRLIECPEKYLSNGVAVEHLKACKKVHEYKFANPSETGYYEQLCNLRIEITEEIRRRYDLM